MVRPGTRGDLRKEKGGLVRAALRGFVASRAHAARAGRSGRLDVLQLVVVVRIGLVVALIDRVM